MFCLTSCLSTFSRYSSVHSLICYSCASVFCLFTAKQFLSFILNIYFVQFLFFFSLPLFPSPLPFHLPSANLVWASFFGLGSPLEASGPLGYSIKMPKQIRWWSMLSLGEWEGQQGIIVHIPRNNLIRPRPSRFVARVVLVITSCHLISLLFVCSLSGRFVHPPSLPGGSPLEASGPLGYSIKMPKQIRWWSMLSLGEWEGQQGIISRDS